MNRYRVALSDDVTDEELPSLDITALNKNAVRTMVGRMIRENLLPVNAVIVLIIKENSRIIS